MTFAFLIYRYFPFGGQQRNMLAMAQEAHRRGHRVTVLCHHWQGDRPAGIEVVEVPVSGWTNHSRTQAFARAAAQILARRQVDLRVGFIKLPELDVYYAADPCFAEKALCQRGWLYRLAPRTRAYLALERAVFEPASGCHILEVSPAQRSSFIRHYGTPEERFHPLIPGISKTRLAPDDYPEVRRRKRRELDIDEGDKVLLALGSGFKTKGLDRSVLALAELRRRGRPARLLVVGQDRWQRFAALARREGVGGEVAFLGGRDDIPELLQAADLLLHPAYRENTGNALLEAMIAGLPVIATRTCGYAHYVEDAAMGAVVADTATAVEIADQAEAVMQTSSEDWHRRGKTFADTASIYDRPGQCVDILQAVAAQRGVAS